MRQEAEVRARNMQAAMILTVLRGIQTTQEVKPML